MATGRQEHTQTDCKWNPDSIARAFADSLTIIRKIFESKAVANSSEDGYERMLNDHIIGRKSLSKNHQKDLPISNINLHNLYQNRHTSSGKAFKTTNHF